MDALKSTDWSQTPIYFHYLRNGRYIHENEEIFSELELQYNISFLNKVDENIQREEEVTLVDTFYNKTMATLEELMCQLNMMYFMDKIRLMMVDVELKIEHIVKIMSRCLKLYKKMDQFIKIFQMIEKKEECDRRDQRDVVLNKRLYVLIQLHLKENPILPIQFIYKSKNILEELKQELISMGVQINDHPIHNPTRSSRYLKQASDSGIIVHSDGKSLSTAFSPGGDPKDETLSGATDGIGHQGARPVFTSRNGQGIFSDSAQMLERSQQQPSFQHGAVKTHNNTEGSEGAHGSGSSSYERLRERSD